MSTTFLSLDHISYTILGKKILDHISLEVKENSITTLIGPNGAGKTTLIKLMAGLIRPSSGKIIRAPNLRLAYVPQKIRFSELLPLRVIDFLKLFETDAAFKKKWLQALNIEHLCQTQMKSLSGGELQKVLLIQAVLTRPQLLLLDEPAQGVDITAQATFYGLVEQVKKTLSCAIVLVSHDLHLVMAKSDQVLCLNGHVCCSGHPEDVRNHPEYVRIFGDSLPGTLAPYHHHHDHEH